MAPTTFSERVAAAVRTLDWAKRNKAELEKLGLRMDLWIANLENAIEVAKAADNRQELLKADLHATTATLDKADSVMYRITSALIDAGAAAYGKGSEQAKQLVTLRSKVRRANPKAEVTLPVAKPNA